MGLPGMAKKGAPSLPRVKNNERITEPFRNLAERVNLERQKTTYKYKKLQETYVPRLASEFVAFQSGTGTSHRLVSYGPA